MLFLYVFLGTVALFMYLRLIVNILDLSKYYNEVIEDNYDRFNYSRFKSLNEYKKFINRMKLLVNIALFIFTFGIFHLGRYIGKFMDILLDIFYVFMKYLKGR